MRARETSLGVADTPRPRAPGRQVLQAGKCYRKPVDDEYRRQLIALEQKAQESYDKTLLTLSGGALGVSFAFVTNFVERGSMQASCLLFGAWSCWALSLAMTLTSHLSSQTAIRRAIKDFDSGRPVKRPGGRYDLLTVVLNVGAGVLFVVGVAFVGIFVWRNV